MKIIKEIIKKEKPISVGDFLSLYKKINNELSQRHLEVDKELKIALLSSFTSKGFEEVLFLSNSELDYLNGINMVLNGGSVMV